VQTGHPLLDRPQYLQAGALGQLEVEQDQIGPRQGNAGDCLLRPGREPDQFDALLLGEQGNQAFQEHQ
jgi:hypothetical protein